MERPSNNNASSSSMSGVTDVNDVDLLPGNSTNGKIVCSKYGIGESGDNVLSSVTNVAKAGDEVLFDINISDSGDIGLYSERESGERGLVLFSGNANSGESNLSLNSNVAVQSSAKSSSSEEFDSNVEDICLLTTARGSGKFCVKSGTGDSV